jgi:hypothetical protein
LCRWIEATHAIPRQWPAGLPRPAENGRDPGRHKRNPVIWQTQSGHYGHCHVPENTHWDPGYTAEEVDFIMSAEFDEDGRLNMPRRAASAGRRPRGRAGAGRRTAPRSTMPDHSVVPVGVSAYLQELTLKPPVSRPSAHKQQARKTPSRKHMRLTAAHGESAAINTGSLLSFVAGVSGQEQQDVLYSVQLAARAASGAADRFTQTPLWYQKYVEVLENLGWASEQLVFSQFEQREGEFRMDQAALAVITAIATQNQLAVLRASVEALEGLAEDDKTIRLFDFHASLESSGNFQLGSVQRAESGALTMALGAFYFHALDERRRFLFFKWGRQQVHFWTAAQRMTLNTDFYALRREQVRAKIAADADQYVSQLVLR